MPKKAILTTISATHCPLPTGVKFTFNSFLQLKKKGGLQNRSLIVNWAHELYSTDNTTTLYTKLIINYLRSKKDKGHSFYV